MKIGYFFGYDFGVCENGKHVLKVQCDERKVASFYFTIEIIVFLKESTSVRPQDVKKASVE